MGVLQGQLARIGNTPLVALDRARDALHLSAKLLGKVESANPGGSIKDRAAYYMIKQAVADGLLAPHGTIVEATSGNTGVGLALVAACMDFKLRIYMPDTMSRERIMLLGAMGAEVMLTPGSEGMSGAIARAEHFARQHALWMPSQFDNPANPRAHEETTGPELLRDSGGDIDVLVAGVGTGGTLTGIARAFKKAGCSARIVAVQPADSPVLTGGAAAPHPLQGIGANFIPKNYDASLVDEVIDISGAQAVEMARLLASREGLLCGYSSGAALAAAVQLAMRDAYRQARIAVILPDGGERYLSTTLFAV
nr:cysteine synthase A [Maliibacterium massiliense]